MNNPQSPDLQIRITVLKKQQEELIEGIAALVAEMAKACDRVSALCNSIRVRSGE